MKKACGQSPAAVKKWHEEDYPVIAAAAKAEGTGILWGAESGLRSDDVRGRGFAPKGQTPVVRVNNKRHGLSVISTVTNKGQMRWRIFEGAINAKILIDFLRRLIKGATKKVFLILDNLRVHHAKPVKAWLAEHVDAIEVFYLPSYSPELNPEERLNADLKQAVELSVQSAFYSTGQRCTASSRLIVTAGIHDQFVAAMAERMKSIKVGHALKSGTDIGPVVSQAQLDQDMKYIDIGQSEGARLVSGGGLVTCDTEGYYLAPTLFADSEAAMRISREEIFGPVANVVRVADYEAALAMANDTEFGLSAGIATTSLKYANHFKRHSQAGMVMVNLPTAGVDYHVPFGGRKGSSYGSREQGRYAQEFYTVVKTSYIGS